MWWILDIDETIRQLERLLRMVRYHPPPRRLVIKPTKARTTRRPIKDYTRYNRRGC